METGVASPAPLSLSKIAVETARPPEKETTEFSLRALHFVERPWQSYFSTRDSFCSSNFDIPDHLSLVAVPPILLDATPAPTRARLQP